MLGCNPANTPINLNLKLGEQSKFTLIDKGQY